MAKEFLGIGIAGLGNISDVHAQAVTASEKGNLVGAYSSREDKIETFSRNYQRDGFTSYEEFLRQPDLDIVSICTPTGTHLDYARQAAEAGKHVVVEKPVEVTLERARKLIETCQRHDVRLAVIYQSRFTDDVIRMKKRIQRGDIGDLFMATASVKWFRSQEYYQEAPWRGTLRLDGGGAVINQAIHTVDLLQWLLGDVETVHAFTGTFTHDQIEGEDNAVATFRCKSGVIGSFTASTSITPPHPRKIQLFGEKGTATLDDFTFRLSNGTSQPGKEDPVEGGAGSSSPLANFAIDAHRNQYDKVCTAILEDRQPPVSGEESLKSLAFVQAIYQSAQTGRPVSMDDLLRNEIG